MTEPIQALPRLRSFITLRHERFGAILFNPFLGQELQLDPIDAYAAALCTGENSWNQIAGAVAERFEIALETARSQTAQLRMLLERAFALGWACAAPTLDVVQPDIPEISKDGPALRGPKSVIWDVTYACNLRCAHCLTDSGRAHIDELDTEHALRLIAALEDAQVLYLSLSGGEPWLRRDIVELLSRIAQGGMRADVATNGVRMPERILRALRDLPVFQVQVSLDGLADVHDALRNVPGAFHASCRTLQRLRDEGVATSISTTVTSENIHQVSALIDLAHALGCVGYKAIPFLPAGRGRASERRLSLSAAQHRTLAQLLAKRRAELTGHMSIATEGGFGFLLDHENTCHSVPPPAALERSVGCSAAYDTLSVGADGTAYPCPFLRDFPLGNLLETPLRTLWARAPTLQALRGLVVSDLSEPCRSCEHAGVACNGGCRAAAWLAHGSLLAQDPGCFARSASSSRACSSALALGQSAARSWASGSRS